jgi:hypothetical protein
MDLIVFHDKIYKKHDKKLYLFEPTWDCFRPIGGIAWNGKSLVAIELFKSNLFDPYYGFGSLETKLLCKQLIMETELSEAVEIKDPSVVWKWYGEENAKWWKDRPCVFLSSDVSRDTDSWKRYLQYLNVRAKTLRRPYHGRSTRRLLLARNKNINESKFNQ